ncbi:hypothetical protein AC96_5239 [Escherichia coli 2-156-04_S4_C2]|nr:hypothetical protein HMPREF1620_00826 [Escherichia coli 909945-2]KDX38398.1 hypothetical protein AC96_5239 [Escherichia coli 2-156-04_S4_C2]
MQYEEMDQRLNLLLAVNTSAHHKIKTLYKSMTLSKLSENV